VAPVFTVCDIKKAQKCQKWRVFRGYRRKKPDFPLQVLGSANALPVGFPLQCARRRSLSDRFGFLWALSRPRNPSRARQHKTRPGICRGAELPSAFPLLYPGGRNFAGAKLRALPPSFFAVCRKKTRLYHQPAHRHHAFSHPLRVQP
jgi:hypothetical protein